ncbi:MAG: hypothetical protein A2Z84_02695 [Tenericutes bacterium GWA2_35_7]|nr:MAG: hypothetical protein A2Z84_02695 [Tenericutes bacterium GWA2_35_7]
MLETKAVSAKSKGGDSLMKKFFALIFSIVLVFFVGASILSVEAGPGPIIVIEDPGDGGVTGEVVEWVYDFDKIYENYPSNPIYQAAIHRVAQFGVLPTLDPSGDNVSMQYYFYKSQIVKYDADTYNQLSLFLEFYKTLMDKSSTMYQQEYEDLLNSFLSEYVPFYDVFNGLSEYFDELTFANFIMDVLYYVENTYITQPTMDQIDDLIDDYCSLASDYSEDFGVIIQEACKVISKKIFEMGYDFVSSFELMDFIGSINFVDLFNNTSDNIALDYMEDILLKTGEDIIIGLGENIPGLNMAIDFIKINYYMIAMYNNYQWATRCAEVSQSIIGLLSFIDQSLALKKNIRLDYVISDINTINSYAAEIPYAGASTMELAQDIEDYFSGAGISTIFFSNTIKTTFSATMGAYFPNTTQYRTIYGHVTAMTYESFIEHYTSLISSQPDISPIESKAVGLPTYYYMGTPQTFF